jgi:hypothetical protein
MTTVVSIKDFLPDRAVQRKNMARLTQLKIAEREKKQHRVVGLGCQAPSSTVELRGLHGIPSTHTSRSLGSDPS